MRRLMRLYPGDAIAKRRVPELVLLLLHAMTIKRSGYVRSARPGGGTPDLHIVDTRSHDWKDKVLDLTDGNGPEKAADFSSEEETKVAFDLKLYKKGIQPIWIEVDNCVLGSNEGDWPPHGRRCFEVRRRSFIACCWARFSIYVPESLHK